MLCLVLVSIHFRSALPRCASFILYVDLFGCLFSISEFFYALVCFDPHWFGLVWFVTSRSFCFVRIVLFCFVRLVVLGLFSSV